MFPGLEKNVYLSSTLGVKPHKHFFKCHPSCPYSHI